MLQLLNILDVPQGAAIEWEGGVWKVNDVRKHAMTSDDNTCWVILDGWKAAGHGDPPKVDIGTMVLTFTAVR